MAKRGLEMVIPAGLILAKEHVPVEIQGEARERGFFDWQRNGGRLNLDKTTPVLIVGRSGTGKTSGMGQITDIKTGKLKHLGLYGKRVLFLDMENRNPTVENPTEFNRIKVRDRAQYEDILDGLEWAGIEVTAENQAVMNQYYAQRPDHLFYREIDYVVIDSYTALNQMLLTAVAYLANGNTYRQFGLFEEFSIALMEKLKKIRQQIFITALVKADPKDTAKKDMAGVKGNAVADEWIESHMNVVLHTVPIYEQTGMQEMVDVKLQYRSNGRNTAMSPNSMFKGELSNNYALITMAIQEFHDK